ncbi:hypothetical protein TMatcc_010653 [Talaromyces marneffei ATCC 18224]
MDVYEQRQPRQNLKSRISVFRSCRDDDSQSVVQFSEASWLGTYTPTNDRVGCVHSPCGPPPSGPGNGPADVGTEQASLTLYYRVMRDEAIKKSCPMIGNIKVCV